MLLFPVSLSYLRCIFIVCSSTLPRESLDAEAAELNERVDKCNVDRMSDVQDLGGKLSLLGKSASRHIDNLKHHVSRECQVSKKGLASIVRRTGLVFGWLR